MQKIIIKYNGTHKRNVTSSSCEELRNQKRPRKPGGLKSSCSVGKQEWKNNSTKKSSMNTDYHREWKFQVFRGSRGEVTKDEVECKEVKIRSQMTRLKKTVGAKS